MKEKFFNDFDFIPLSEENVHFLYHPQRLDVFVRTLFVFFWCRLQRLSHLRARHPHRSSHRSEGVADCSRIGLIEESEVATATAGAIVDAATGSTGTKPIAEPEALADC